MTDNKTRFEIEETDRNVDIKGVFSLLRAYRKAIIITTACFMAFGLFLAIFSPREFKATSVFVPQTNQSFTSRYSSIASMMGLDMDMSGSDGPISPKVYPLFLGNPEFLRDLMYSPIHFSTSDEPITIYDYYTNPDYQKSNVVNSVLQYTIGLPGLIIGALSPDREDAATVVEVASDAEGVALDPVCPVVYLTKDEAAVAKLLRRNLEMEVDLKRGFLTLTVVMPEARAASEVCETTYQLLKRYVTEFKVTKARANLEYLERQYEEAKADYRRKQERLAVFVDRNRGVISAQASVERSRLESDCELARSLYQELSKNVLSSRVKLEESNVSFAEIAPSMVPHRKSKPSGVVLILVWTILGLALSSGIILAKDKWRTLSGK